MPNYATMGRQLDARRRSGFQTSIGNLMSKKYQVIQEVTRNSDSGFLAAIRVALVDFTCMGERRFDLAGYPYENADEALWSDWVAIGSDARRAIKAISVENAELKAGEDRKKTTEPTGTDASS